ncbi:hypothetical protein N656DRAFT_616998 [Canariomyces notabilis]|uniref:Rhodopsin domain-containing protein n=1 Tax=Canariomyces notabilis TaxID=2074819 RepID=A0AAN6YTL1_9PEZI|nr:hypothetical protein N656DRAFT_616998 [Canariomyces arenarius]
MDPTTAARNFPGDKKRQDELIITSVVMTAMAALFVLGRCISRFILIHNPGPDDYLMICSLLLTVGYVVNLFLLRANNIGFPMSTFTPDNMVNFMKITLAIQVMYYANVFCIKISILLTYLRFAVSKTFRVVCWGTIVLHAVFFVTCVLVTLLQCLPIQKMWDFVGAIEGSCIDRTVFFYSTSGFNIITDIWIIIIPIKTLHSIQRPRREKIALFLIFGVGTFAAVASIVRLHTIYIYTLSADPFRDGIPVNLWSIIEVTIAISCASVPALKPLFSSRQRRATRAAKSSGSSSGPRYARSQTAYRHHARIDSDDDSAKKLQIQQSHSRSIVHGSDQQLPVELKGRDIGVRTDVVVVYDDK